MIYSLHIYRTLFKECMVGWSLLCDSLSRCWQSPCRVAKDGDHHMLASEDKSYIEVEVCRGLICRSREREVCRKKSRFCSYFILGCVILVYIRNCTFIHICRPVTH